MGLFAEFLCDGDGEAEDSSMIQIPMSILEFQGEEMKPHGKPMPFIPFLR